MTTHSLRKLNFLVLFFICLFSQGTLSCSSQQSPASLIFITQPESATPFGTTNGVLNAIQVQLLDASGNLFTGSATVTISISHQPNSGFYTGLLSGTTTVSAEQGVATFEDLSISQIGNGYTLQASLSGASSALSESFNITASTEGFNPTNRPGFEIAYLGDVGADYQGYVLVYVDQEPNPIDASAFETYTNPGYVQNTPRFATFNFGHTVGSPSSTAGPLTLYSDPFGYTWGYIAQVQNFNWPFDPEDYPDISPTPSSGWEAGQVSTDVPAGVVKYTNNNKDQQLLFTALDPDTQEAILRYFVTDEWGNVYIMKSANNANNNEALITAAFEAAVLPEGWQKSTAYLSQDLFVNPIYGGASNAQFLEFRDSADNAYSQIVWGSSGDSIAQQIGNPMPLWAGAAGARVNGTPGDDSMFGSDGDDQFYPDTGNDTIEGGGGVNGLSLTGSASQYRLSQSGSSTILTGPDGTKTFTQIQYLQYGDRRILLEE